MFLLVHVFTLQACHNIKEIVEEARAELAKAKVDLPNEPDSLTLLMRILNQMHKFRNEN